MLIPYGTAETSIGCDAYLINCPACEADQWSDVLLVSTYYHFAGVPIFPVVKHANVYCKICGHKKIGMAFNARHFSDFEVIKNQYRHPWYTYIGAVLFAMPFVIGILFNIFSH